jgi:hypothetical protein
MESDQMINPELWTTLCALDHDVDELRDLVVRNSNRISPMLPPAMTPGDADGEDSHDE